MTATYYTSSPGPLADGSRFQASALTCAARGYPLGSRLLLTTRAGRHVIVTVRDRGPAFDCTPAAFRRLAGPHFRRVGRVPVRCRVLSRPKKRPHNKKRAYRKGNHHEP